MFCRFCGRQLPDDSRFCSGCGKPLDATSQASGGNAGVDLSALEGFFTDAVNKKEAEKDFTILGGVLLEYKGAGGRVTVPDGVTAINEKVFCDKKEITSVILPEGLTSIGRYAFCGCDKLSEVKFPSSLTSIGVRAFSGCSALTEIKLPAGLKSLDPAAFMACGIKSVAIPGGVEVIKGNDANFDPGPFSDCKDLTTVVVSPGVKRLGESAFRDCYALTTVVLPHGLTEIGKWAFSGCGKLTGLTIPSTVTEIGYEAFDACNSLGSINIPGSVKRIGEYAFKRCGLWDGDPGLHTVIIEEGVQEIGKCAFEYCKRLSYVKLPDSLQVIGDLAFWNCESLVSLKIPRGVKNEWGKMGCQIVAGCTSLRSVELPGQFRDDSWLLLGDDQGFDKKLSIYYY